MSSYKKHLKLGLFLTLIFITNLTINAASEHVNYTGKKVVVIYPVIDMNTSLPDDLALRPQFLASLPLTSDPYIPGKCPRAYQGLYNEIGDCIAQEGDYLQIAYNNIIYGYDNNNKVLNTFWTHVKGVIPLDTITSESIKQSIPNPEYAKEPTIVLTYPWHQFSVGTRFKYNPHEDAEDAYAIEYADYLKETLIIDYVPKKYAIREEMVENSAKRQCFISIINQLIDHIAHYKGVSWVIPYVWGGSSFIQAQNNDNVYQNDNIWYKRKKRGVKEIYPLHTGYDCSGLIMRMAKIVGIDLPWKTTTIMQKKMKPLDENDILEKGDIIWIPGHVMIVSDIPNNELIEARSYRSGYGCVHRMQLHQLFDGIHTYQELQKCCHANGTVAIKNKKGDIQNNACECKLLKLID